MIVEKVCSFIERRRRLLLLGWIVHAVLVHYFILGFVTWDGLSYRVAPIVELAQHGSFGFDKYETWIFRGYLPFVELVHLPFLAIFRLPGVLLGFPLVALPLSVVAVFVFVREITSDERAGTFGALAWLAVPAMNNQPFSGYIDFAVCALLAFVIFTIVRLRRVPNDRRAFAWVAMATALFTLSRQQGIYILVMLFPFVGYPLFAERVGFRLRLPGWRRAVFAIAALAVGSFPALVWQGWKYVHYGSPTYPYQFQALGLKLGTGMPLAAVFADGGLRELTASAFAKATWGAWFFPRTWPVGCFSDSRHMGGGFLLVLALCLLVFALQRATPLERWFLAGAVLISFVARDFWLPRYAYTLLLSIALILGRGLAEASRSVRWRWAFWALFGGMGLHLLRPEFDVAMLPELGPRLDVANTTHIFNRDFGVIQPYPDQDARFIIVGYLANGFALPVFGRRLTNQVLHSVKVEALGERCAGVRPEDRDPSYLFIDDLDATKDCDRTCAILSSTRDRCLAYQLRWSSDKTSVTERF